MDKLIIGNLQFNTLIAISEEQQEKGLMFRKNAVIMTFPYNTAEVRKFWMKNTFVPLDIIFCKKGAVCEIFQGFPLSETLIGPDYPTDMVIEMPFNFTNKFEIKAGQKAKLSYSFQTLANKYSYQLNKTI